MLGALVIGFGALALLGSTRSTGCPACGGVSHPASGSFDARTGRVTCGPCVRRFWDWAAEHGKKTYRVGPKGKGSKRIPFPTGITRGGK